MGFWEIKMKISKFEVRSGEILLFRTVPNRKWYVITWKIVSGGVGIATLTFIAYLMLAGSTESAFISILPVWVANVLTKFLYLGLIPLATTAWVIEDMACIYIGEFILTDQRVWIRGSPYAWSYSVTPLEDISSLNWRRDAIFIKQKATHKIQVHMFSNGKLFVRAYQQFVGKAK
jgi:hypothetical protein